MTKVGAIIAREVEAGEAKGKAEGKAEGMVSSLPTVLSAKGNVPENRSRCTGCGNI